MHNVEGCRVDDKNSDRVVDEDRRGSDDGDDVVAHNVKRRHRIVVDVTDVEVHLARQRSARTPPTWRATVNEIWSAVHLGVCP